MMHRLATLRETDLVRVKTEALCHVASVAYPTTLCVGDDELNVRLGHPLTQISGMSMLSPYVESRWVNS